jgi:hypothetical protein
LLLAALVV